MLKYIFILSVISIFIVGTVGFRTKINLRQFLENELNILEMLHNHIYLKETHLQLIASQLERLSAVVSGRELRDEYLSNPLSTLTLVRRITTDWLPLANLMPGETDLSGNWKKFAEQTHAELAVGNLARVQLTYNLSTDHLADSVLEKTPANDNLTGTDCYWMARHYYQQHHHREAVQWLDQALTKHDNTVPRHWLLELAVLAHCFLGNGERSTTVFSSLIMDFPDHKPSRYLVKDWQFMTKTGCERAKPIMMKKKIQASPLSRSWTSVYNKLCQGRVKSSPDLKCRYVHYHKRHLRLAPFRLEELHLDPPVVIFHNAINDGEIQEAKSRVNDKLKRSTVLGSSNGTSRIDPYRTSETAWVYPGQSSLLDKLTKKVKDMTNLDTQFTEGHQISRYGLGAEYLFHTDSFGEDYHSEHGDRIATLMFYLSDVPSGGHTVFKDLELSVKPQKGSAVLWFNLKPDGSVDSSSMHAGCSVLMGTKWVLNRWFHELNNDITRPCDVDGKQTHKYFYL